MNFAQVVVNSLITASELGLIAIGLTLTFSLLKFGNFAHVEMAVAGAYMAWALNTGMGLSFAAIFGWTLRAGRTHRSLPTAARRAVWLRFAVGNFGYAIAIVVALTPTSWSALAALALIGLVAVYYIAERTPAPRGPSDAPVPPGDVEPSTSLRTRAGYVRATSWAT